MAGWKTPELNGGFNVGKSPIFLSSFFQHAMFDDRKVNWMYSLEMTNIAIEHDQEIVHFPMNNLDFPQLC